MSRFFGNPVHTAFVVPDVDAALAAVVKSGIGPVFLLDHVSGPGRYRGERHDALISAAFVYSGDTLWEFLSPHDDVPSSYSEFLARNPGGGLHHVAYECTDFAAAMARAAAAGTAFRVVQEYMATGDSEPFEIYMEPINTENPVLVQLMKPGVFDSWFAQMKAASRDWDGSDPIRDGSKIMPELANPVTAAV